jgi:hypothetical protein
MEIQVPANAFDWAENCPHCRMPMAKVLLTTERIKIEPSTINGGEPYPSWFYEWSQKPCYICGAGAGHPSPNGRGAGGEGNVGEGQGATADHPAVAFPTWYCVRCITVWVVFRGLWFRTSFAPAVPGGIVNQSLGHSVAQSLSPDRLADVAQSN